MDRRDSSVLLPLVQINELSHALEIERDLVLKTQENYMKLKKKFLQLSEESQSWQLEMETKLAAQTRQIELLEREKGLLKEENQRIFDESIELKSKIDDISRQAKAKEVELRRSFNNQVEELLQHTSKPDNEQNAVKYEELWKKELRESGGRVQELLSEVKTIQSLRLEEVHSLKEELRTERLKCVELQATLQRQAAELESAKSLANIRQSKSIALRSDMNRRLKEAMEKEVAWLSKEEDFRKTLKLRTTSFENKLADLERVSEEKTNSLTLALEQKEKASSALVEQLERERNELEMSVAELRKNLASGPSNSDELKCLRKVVEEKEKQLTSVTRRYRRLVRQVETSLAHLEKQQRETSNKLEQSIIPSFIQNFTT
uniref:Mitotic spindle assembly checkpoint protein MAD1 n=1 Tax=Angiostrongylus cantonensis TaxID=6313 RepID=A0A0K0DIP3_ANGCA